MRNVVKKIFRTFGLEVIKTDTYNRLLNKKNHCRDAFYQNIIDFAPDIVFDVGANAGQYGATLRKYGFLGEIVSFEPQKGAYAVLRELASADGNWTAYNYALGAGEGKIVLNISKNSVSSSFLDVEQSIAEFEPGVVCTDKQEVDVKDLDSLFNKHFRAGLKALLKIDVQGYEKQVLDGATKSLDNISALQVEMSIVHHYSGEKLFCEMIELLKNRGFSLFDFEKVFSHPVTHRLIQIDGLFTRHASELSHDIA